MKAWGKAAKLQSRMLQSSLSYGRCKTVGAWAHLMMRKVMVLMWLLENCRVTEAVWWVIKGTCCHQGLLNSLFNNVGKIQSWDTKEIKFWFVPEAIRAWCWLPWIRGTRKLSKDMGKSIVSGSSCTLVLPFNNIDIVHLTYRSDNSKSMCYCPSCSLSSVWLSYSLNTVLYTVLYNLYHKYSL